MRLAPLIRNAHIGLPVDLVFDAVGSDPVCTKHCAYTHFLFCATHKNSKRTRVSAVVSNPRRIFFYLGKCFVFPVARLGVPHLTPVRLDLTLVPLSLQLAFIAAAFIHSGLPPCPHRF